MEIEKLPTAPKPKKKGKKQSLLIPRIKARLQLFLADDTKRKDFFNRINSLFIIVFLFIAISIMFIGFNWKSALLSIALYFLYEEFIHDSRMLIVAGRN